MKGYELAPGVTTNEGQTEALNMLFEFLGSTKKTFLLLGRGGTGKTTILKKLLSEYKGNVLGVTVSHKAKKVLGQSIGHDKVATLASALLIKLNEETGKFVPDQWARERYATPIEEADLVIVDECSMVSEAMVQEIKNFLSIDAKIIFTGDSAQLPSVEDGRISSIFNLPNRYTLTERVRQVAGSPILDVCDTLIHNQENHIIKLRAITEEQRNNKADEVSKSSVVFTDNINELLSMYVEDFKTNPSDVNHCKIITFNNHRHISTFSVKSLNSAVRRLLWGDESRKPFLQGELVTAYEGFSPNKKGALFNNSEDFIVHRCSASTLHLETKIPQNTLEFCGINPSTMQYNIVYLDIENEDGKLLTGIPVVHPNSRDLFTHHLTLLFKKSPRHGYILMNQFADIQYAYAITTHKSQGSTYNNAYVIEDNILGSTNVSSILAKNQSLYVACSRPKHKLVVYSKEKNNLKTELAQEVEAELAEVVEKPKRSGGYLKIYPQYPVRARLESFDVPSVYASIDGINGFTSTTDVQNFLHKRGNLAKGKYKLMIDFLGKEREYIKIIK